MKSTMEQDRLLLEDEVENDEVKARSLTPWIRQTPSIVVVVFLTVSVGINFLSMSLDARTEASSRECMTRFASLEWDTETQFVYNGIHDSDNKTATNEAWDAIEYDHGSVALDYAYAQAKGLPRAQKFPWDDSKGLYFINAYHGVHCLKALRETMLQLHDGQPLTHDFRHIMHCFEALLDDIKCFADDTPRYTIEEHPGKAGFEQKRKCRDWNQLVAFAEEHYSCWKDIHPTDKDFDTLLRYRYCPEDSPYNVWIHAIFGDFDKDGEA